MGSRRSTTERSRIIGRVREAPDACVDGACWRDCVAPVGSRLLPWHRGRIGGVTRGFGSTSRWRGHWNGLRQLVVAGSSHVAAQVAGEIFYSKVRNGSYFSTSKLKNGKQETRHCRRATEHDCFHGFGARAHIPVGAVASGLPWVLDHPTVELQRDFATQGIPWFCPDVGKYADVFHTLV